MKLDGYYGSDLNNYYELLNQLPNNEIVKQGIGMAQFLGYKVDVIHLGTTRRVMLNIYMDNKVLELSIWINKEIDDILAVSVNYTVHNNTRNNCTYSNVHYSDKEIFEIFRNFACGIKVDKFQMVV